MDAVTEAVTELPVNITAIHITKPFVNVIRFIVITFSLILAVTNPIAIAAILKAKLYERNRTSILIVFQLSGDTLCGAIIFFTLNYTLIHRELGLQDNGVVKIVLADFIYFFFLASLSNSFLVSFERFFALHHPLKYRVLVTPFRVTICMASMWISCLLLIICPTVYKACTQRISVGNQFYMEMHKIFPEGYTSSILAPVIFACMVGTCASYAGLVLKYRQFRRQIVPNVQVAIGQQLLSKQHRMTATAFLVSMVTILCWFPTAFFLIHPPQNTTLQLFHLSGVLLQIPGLVNCIMYFTYNSDFKSALFKLFPAKKAVTPVTPIT